jgi:SRSO17 transposase
MDVAQIRALKPRLDNYLARFEDCFSRCDTREHLAVYVTRQLSDLAQKSVEPMALAAGTPPRTLQEFLARYKWDEDARRPTPAGCGSACSPGGSPRPCSSGS